MSFSPQSMLSDAKKLDVLRRLDQFREWHSLDDKRFCLVCSKIINGWQIEIADRTRGNGASRLSCPTERCNSIPMDWVLPTNELVALAETATWLSALADTWDRRLFAVKALAESPGGEVSER